MRVAVVQHDIVWEDAVATRTRLVPQIAAAAATGARLVVLTEMFATGFSMRTDRTGEPPGGPTTAFLAEHAARHDVWVCGSLVERPDDGGLPTNTLVLAGPAGELHRYRKVHPFTHAGEHEHFAAGTAPMTVAVKGVRLTLSVCYDLRFADGYWDAAPDTDCYVVVANWPAARRHHWATLVRARAIENQAYVVAANRVGEGGGLSYAGDSRVVDPMGEELATAAGGEAILTAEVDPAVVTATRDRFPFLRDR